MEREILFRGKDYYGNWVYGDLIRKRYDGSYYIQDKNGLGSDIQNEETIGQFTGLKDKNGVNIFEGDIVIAKDIKSEVFFKFGSFRVRGITMGAYCDFLNKEQILGLRIIGNIHDNKNLLYE